MSSITNYLIGVICTNLAKNLGHQRMIQRPKTTWGPSKNSIRRWVPICNHSKPHVLYWLVVSNICYFGSSVEFCQSAAPVRNSLLVLKSLLRTAWLRLLWSFWRHSEWRRSGWCRFSRKSCCSQCHSPCRQVVALEETLSHTLEMVQIFILSFFCPFLVSFFFVISVLPVIFLSFQFWSVMFCHFFGSCFCHFVQFSQKYGKYQKLFGKWQKNDKKWPCFEKNAIFATCKIVIFLVFFWSCFCHLVEILQFVCYLFVILVQFSQKYGSISKIIRKMTEKMTMLREKRNFCDLQNDKQNERPQLKWQTKWQTKLKWQKMKKQWQTKLKWQKKWQQKRQKNDNLNSLIFSTFASLSFF